MPPAATEEPAASGATAPADEPSSFDELFDEPAATPPTETPSTPPVTESAAEPAPEPSAPVASAEETEEVDVTDLFGEPSASEPAAEEPAAEEPATEQPAAEQPAAEEPAPQDAPADEEKEEEPAEPLDFESLFGPSSSTEILSAPGGWASEASRTWHTQEGEQLGTARVGQVSAAAVTLLTTDGQSLVVRFSELSDADLTFLRQQIDARQTLLAEQQRAESQLAERGR